MMMDDNLPMWAKVFREGLAPQLSTRGLLALKEALVNDSEQLLQGTTVEPPALECCRDWPCAAACPVCYCGWHGGELDSAAVGALTDFFAAVAAKADELTGEYASIRHFTNFVDGSPRWEMREKLLEEVCHELSERAVRAAPPPADEAAVEYGVLRHPRHEDTTVLPAVAIVADA
jgi:hypothetical protein